MFIYILRFIFYIENLTANNPDVQKLSRSCEIVLFVHGGPEKIPIVLHDENVFWY